MQWTRELLDSIRTRDRCRKLEKQQCFRSPRQTLEWRRNENSKSGRTVHISMCWLTILPTRVDLIRICFETGEEDYGKDLAKATALENCFGRITCSFHVGYCERRVNSLIDRARGDSSRLLIAATPQNHTATHWYRRIKYAMRIASFSFCSPHSQSISLQWQSGSYISFILDMNIETLAESRHQRGRSCESAEKRWHNHTSTHWKAKLRRSTIGKSKNAKLAPKIGSCRASNWTKTLFLRTTRFTNE